MPHGHSPPGDGHPGVQLKLQKPEATRGGRAGPAQLQVTTVWQAWAGWGVGGTGQDPPPASGQASSEVVSQTLPETALKNTRIWFTGGLG